MKTKIIEASTPSGNWGKFLIGRCDSEWERHSLIPGHEPTKPLLAEIGDTPQHVWVLDLQTGEGARFYPGGLARADLAKHRVWVCVVFEHFLEWLYEQDLRDLDALPDHVVLDAPFAMAGYRRRGQSAAAASASGADGAQRSLGPRTRANCDGTS